jgi:hypothetical protein
MESLDAEFSDHGRTPIPGYLRCTHLKPAESWPYVGGRCKLMVKPGTEHCVHHQDDE